MSQLRWRKFMAKLTCKCSEICPEYDPLVYGCSHGGKCSKYYSDLIKKIFPFHTQQTNRVQSMQNHVNGEK